MPIVGYQEATPPHRVLAAVLGDGADLHQELAEIATRCGITAAVIHLLGGLREVALVETDIVTGQKKPPLVFRRHLEIIGGNGMISLYNQTPHIHLHLTLAFQDNLPPYGVSVIGGHVAYALAHAVEALIHCYDGLALIRQPDPHTGLPLWRLAADGQSSCSGVPR